MDPDPDRTRIAPTEVRPGSTAPTVAGSLSAPLPPEVAPLAGDPARRVGKYVIAQQIGAGGMGSVHKAFDTDLRRWAAVKFLTAAGDDAARAYFLREARLAARLAHPNIAAIYDVGEHNGQPYLAMQYIDGQNLAAARRRMSLPQVVAALRTVAEAVRIAHAANIIHRDIKPANIMVDAAGQVFVMDFGLAKENTVDGRSLGGSGAIVGTPSYMSPEQARGKAGPQSDLYSLGATLYDLVTGRAPFVGETVADVMRQVFSQEPVWPRKLNVSVAPDLEAIVLHCLEKEPSRRYATATELIEDLDAFLRGDPLRHAARPTWLTVLRARIRKQPLLWGLGAALVVAIVAGAGFGAYGLVTAAREAEERARVEREERARTEAEKRKAEERLAGIYLEKGRQAFDRGDTAAAALFYAEAEAIHPSPAARANAAAALRGPARLRAILADEGGSHLGFSPDGKLLLVSGRQNGLRLWSVDDVRKVADIPGAKPVLHVAFSPDSRRLLARTIDSTVIYDPAAGRALCEIRPPKGSRDPLFTADGRRVLSAGEDGVVAFWHAETGEPAPGRIGLPAPPAGLLVAGATLVAVLKDGVAFAALDAPEAPVARLQGVTGPAVVSADGTRLMTADARHLQVWDVPKRAAIGKPAPIDSRVRLALFTTDGSRLVTAHDDGSLRAFHPDTGEPYPGSTMRIPPGEIALHARERLIAQIVEDKRGARLTYVSPRPTLSCFLPHDGDASTAVFSPAGTLLAVGRHSETARLWEIDPACWKGSIVARGAPVVNIVVRPDGGQIAGRCADASIRLWRPGAPADEERVLRGHEAEVTCLEYSSDGRRLFSGDNRGRGALWDPERAERIAELAHDDGVLRAMFLSDGASLLTLTKQAVMRWDARTGARLPSPLDAIRFDHADTVAVTPGGGRIAAVRNRTTLTVWDGASGRALVSDLAHDENVEVVGLSADGSCLATGTGDGRLRLWDAATGRPLRTPTDREIDGFVFIGDTARVAIFLSGNLMRVWDLRQERWEGKTVALGGEASFLSITPDGRWLLTRGRDGLCVWDTAGGEQVGGPVPESTYAASLAPTGAFLATMDSNRIVRLWDTSYLTTTASAAELRREASRRTGMKLADDGRVEAMSVEEWKRLR
jgi:WD40 repeat protein/predicted Ser/Thr protein kinase